MNDELERTWKEAILSCLIFCLSVCPAGLITSIKELSQDGGYSSRDPNPGSLKYVAGMLNIQPQLSLNNI
jgi:hypothetical protein